MHANINPNLDRRLHNYPTGGNNLQDLLSHGRPTYQPNRLGPHGLPSLNIRTGQGITTPVTLIATCTGPVYETLYDPGRTYSIPENV